MMAGLFAIFSLAIVSIFCNWRRAAMAFVGFGIALSLLMLWHHATDILKINW